MAEDRELQALEVSLSICRMPNGTARGVDDSYVRSIASLGFLAPDIQAAIVEGRQPAGLTIGMLQNMRLPIGWEDQRAVLGFRSAASL